MYKIAEVVHGKTAVHPDANSQDPYKIAKDLGIYVEVDHPFSYLTSDVIIERIVSNRQKYEERNRKKEAKEIAMIAKQSSK